MNFGLRTVRAKLTVLVGLSVVVMAATLPLLSWLMHTQLLDEIDDRVIDGQKSFEEELADDISDLTLAARALSIDPATTEAMDKGDTKEMAVLAELVLSVYPDIDVLLVDKTGAVVKALGCSAPPKRLEEIPEVKLALHGETFQGVVAHGCEEAHAPAEAMALPLKNGGAVAVLLPLDKRFFDNASSKLGLELSLRQNTAPLVHTARFPVGIGLGPRGESTLAERGPTTWAVSGFEPRGLVTTAGPLTVVTALDVTDVKSIVRRNLTFSILVLAFAALVSLLTGARLASIMSRALARVNVALKKLEQQEYVHVDAIKTGDELEDLAEGFNTMVDGLKERDKLRTTMGKYMTAAVIEHLMAGKVQLGGETLEVTILFTDIRSFTSISEKMDAQALVGLLNEYFTEMVAAVMAEDGVVDKYIGDAIMAVFGAPVPKKDDALHAVRAAVKMRVALAHLNERLRARGVPQLKTGIGIHTGEVVAGNIGSERRMEYTVIGDAVNLASRLESSTKELGVEVLISEDTYERVKDSIDARVVKEITVKGRAKPVRTYEVLGIRGEESLPKLVQSVPPSDVPV